MRLVKLFLFTLSMLLFIGIIGAGGGIYILWNYGKNLPDYKQLSSYQLPTTTRIHAGDGRLITEYASQKRIFVPISSIPREIINAVIATEDKNFYKHHGIDPIALTRAVIDNIGKYIQKKRFVGASTITQQVAKNFLLTNEASLERKIKEAILAFRIERALSKDRILELYLNESYLGYRSYGVAAAALNYFNKSLDELTTAQVAYLAALLKAPSNYHPVRKYDAAIRRRNWVIGRMEKEGYIDADTAKIAIAEKLEIIPREDTSYVNADYFIEEVRRKLVKKFSMNQVNEGGLSVRTSLDPQLQIYAQRALRNGLEAYDRRHGYRGAVANFANLDNWQNELSQFKMLKGVQDWQLAIILALDKNIAHIGFKDGNVGEIPMPELLWARKALKNQQLGNEIKQMSDIFKVGDVILTQSVTMRPPKKDGDKPTPYPPHSFGLRQLPVVNGAIVVLDPHSGRVLAMSGGYSFDMSQFNRAIQAQRQPGSAFKPFVYLTALDKGYTPATMILDAPFVLNQGHGLKKWKPANYSKKFYGPSPMRIGIEKSRNLMTVRLAQAIGMDAIVKTAADFNIIKNMPAQLSMALGAGEVNLLDLTAGYAMLVNGGKKITPSMIDRVQNHKGITIYRSDKRKCDDCQVRHWEGQKIPKLPDNRQQLTDSASAYQVVSMMEGVVQRGTGRRIKSIGKPLAGKTGTSNDSKDTWFIGFTPDLVAGVFVGMDQPVSLGTQPWGGQETGSSVAVPIFKQFMELALANKTAIPFRTPPNVQMVRIDADSGTLATAASKNIFIEAFKPGTAPSIDGDILVIDGSDRDNNNDSDIRQITVEATSGLY